MHNSFFVWDEDSDHLVAADPFDDIEDAAILKDMQQIQFSCLLFGRQSIYSTEQGRSK